jgi:hypothetical protein
MADPDKQLGPFMTWAWRIGSVLMIGMALNELSEGLATGTIGNLMARGEPSPETIVYEDRPGAFLGMVFMWLVALATGIYMFRATWFSSDDD